MRVHSSLLATSPSVLTRPHSDLRSTLRQLAGCATPGIIDNSNTGNAATCTGGGDDLKENDTTKKSKETVTTPLPTQDDVQQQQSWSTSLMNHVDLMSNIFYDNVGGAFSNSTIASTNREDSNFNSFADVAEPNSIIDNDEEEQSKIKDVKASATQQAPLSGVEKSEVAGQRSVVPDASRRRKGKSSDFPERGFGRWRETGLLSNVSSLSMNSGPENAPSVRTSEAARKRCVNEWLKYLLLFSAVTLIGLAIIRALISRGVLIPASQASQGGGSTNQNDTASSADEGQNGTNDDEVNFSVLPLPTSEPSMPRPLVWLVEMSDRSFDPTDPSTPSSENTFSPTSVPSAEPDSAATISARTEKKVPSQGLSASISSGERTTDTSSSSPSQARLSESTAQQISSPSQEPATTQPEISTLALTTTDKPSIETSGRPTTDAAAGGKGKSEFPSVAPSADIPSDHQHSLQSHKNLPATDTLTASPSTQESTVAATSPSVQPTTWNESDMPTASPIELDNNSNIYQPSSLATSSNAKQTLQPTDTPSHGPTLSTSNPLSYLASGTPSEQSSALPSAEASNEPSFLPTMSPTASPVTPNPTAAPSIELSPNKVKALSTCRNESAESQYRASLIKDIDRSAYQYLEKFDMFNLSWRMELEIGNRNEHAETFGPNNEHEDAVRVKAMQTLLFWSTSKAEYSSRDFPLMDDASRSFVQLVGLHSSDIQSVIQLGIAFVSLYGMTVEEGIDEAKHVAQVIETMVPGGFDNPIFTAHAFAYDVSGRAGLVIGDGMLSYLENIPKPNTVPFDIALEAKIGSMVGWHLQHIKFGVQNILPTDEINNEVEYQYRSLFADVLGTYYVAHPKGGRLRGSDVCEHYLTYARSTGTALCDTETSSGTVLLTSEQKECAAVWAIRWAWIDNALTNENETGVASLAELRDRFDARYERIKAVDRVETCPEFTSIECVLYRE